MRHLVIRPITAFNNRGCTYESTLSLWAWSKTQVELIARIYIEAIEELGFHIHTVAG
jgi:hypothetical protein